MCCTRVIGQEIQRGKSMRYSLVWLCLQCLISDLADALCSSVVAYDISNSNKNNFNVTVQFNSTIPDENADGFDDDIILLRVPRLVNMVCNWFKCDPHWFIVSLCTNVLLSFCNLFLSVFIVRSHQLFYSNVGCLVQLWWISLAAQLVFEVLFPLAKCIAW